MALNVATQALFNAETALREGMGNIVLVIIGENLRRHTGIMFGDGFQINDSLKLWAVEAIVDYPPTGRKMHCKATIPVLSPDAENGGTRIADRFFKVTVDDYLEHFHFEAWCECNPHNGAKVIVRQVSMSEVKSPDLWLIGGGIDEYVEYRGEFARMPQWAKDIANKNYGVWICVPGAMLGPICS